MPRNSLALRLVGSAAIVSIVLLLAAGLLLNKLFSSAMERNFDQQLHGVLDELLANVELTKSGELRLGTVSLDAKFNRPLQGWYWQITPIDDVAGHSDLVSPSLLEQRFSLSMANSHIRDATGLARFYLTDVNRTRLRAIEQRLTLFGHEQEFSFLVAGDFDGLRSEIEHFSGLLFGILAMLGIGLVGAIVAQVMFGLRPMHHMKQEIAKVREGEKDHLQASYPTELEPVAKEMNTLLRANTEVIERARTQVGNLAHALKTPLSVLANEAVLSKSKFAGKVEEQTQIMRDQVSLYLDRARRAARAQSIGAVTEVALVAAALARTLQRIHMDKNLTITVNIPADVKFRGEQQDLEEMLGNLMDNASKWAAKEVLVTADLIVLAENSSRKRVSIKVADDGPGLPESKYGEAMQRGRRLDETTPGTGLGLSIVAEIVAMYDGELTLDKSQKGGLLVLVELPSL